MSKAKTFGGQDIGVSDPSDDFEAVVPGPDPLPRGKPKYLYVGTGGTLHLVNIDGDTVPHIVPSGAYVWARPTHVLDTGDADDIVAYY